MKKCPDFTHYKNTFFLYIFLNLFENVQLVTKWIKKNRIVFISLTKSKANTCCVCLYLHLHILQVFLNYFHLFFPFFQNAYTKSVKSYARKLITCSIMHFETLIFKCLFSYFTLPYKMCPYRYLHTHKKLIERFFGGKNLMKKYMTLW